jgi:hypothetical protein
MGGAEGHPNSLGPCGCVLAVGKREQATVHEIVKQLNLNWRPRHPFEALLEPLRLERKT